MSPDWDIGRRRTGRPGWGRKIGLQVGGTVSWALSMNEFAINDRQGQLSCFFLHFFGKFELCRIKIDFWHDYFFAGNKKDMISKELKFYSLIKTEQTKTTCFYAHSAIYGKSQEGREREIKGRIGFLEGITRGAKRQKEKTAE